MTPEAGECLNTAERVIARARRMLDAGLEEDAGRAAYLTAYHAAQALIFDRPGKIPKTHNGVQAQFWTLTQHDRTFPADVRKFLARAYELKTMADDETDPSVLLSPEAARHAVDRAQDFLTRVADVLSPLHPSRS